MILIHKETAEIIYVWEFEDEYFFCKDSGYFPWAYRVDAISVSNYELLGWL